MSRSASPVCLTKPATAFFFWFSFIKIHYFQCEALIFTQYPLFGSFCNWTIMANWCLLINLTFLNLQFHDNFDYLYGSDPYIWEQEITIRSVDCYCMYPYAKCWDENREGLMEGCGTENSLGQELQLFSMSKWKKARIEDLQVNLWFHSSGSVLPNHIELLEKI